MVPLLDSHFRSGLSAPASPKQRFEGAAEPFDLYCHYTSAPTSPTRAAAIFSHFNSIATSSGVPFNWEEKPSTPKSPGSPTTDATGDEFDFAIGFSGRRFDKLRQPEPPELTAADELFEEGMIRPLKPPPRLQYQAADDKSTLESSSPRSPKSWGLCSPRRRGSAGDKGIDPFTAATVEATRERGRRERAAASSSTAARKGSRSLSPLRGGGEGAEGGILNQTPDSFSSISVASAVGGEALKGTGSKKWRLKDLLLFRSASEGRATGRRSKDPLRKYYTPASSSLAELKGSSFRRMGGKEHSTSTRWTRDAVATASPHELHYTANRAAAVERKKKTALPYRHSFFSFLGFNSAMNSVARGYGGY